MTKTVLPFGCRHAAGKINYIVAIVHSTTCLPVTYINCMVTNTIKAAIHFYAVVLVCG